MEEKRFSKRIVFSLAILFLLISVVVIWRLWENRTPDALSEEEMFEQLLREHTATSPGESPSDEELRAHTATDEGEPISSEELDEHRATSPGF